MPITRSTECQNNQTAIIVLNWNAPQDTIQCLESLLPLVEKNQARIIVCDNDSNDNSVDLITRWALMHFPDNCENADEAQFVLFQIESNSGYAAGNNVGIQYALDHDFQYVWILNNDTVVAENALTALFDCIEQHPEVGCYGSTLVDYSEPDKVQCAAGCRYNPLTTVRTEIYHDCDLAWVNNQQQNIKLDYVCGAAMFLRADALRKIGLLNQQFFLYYEELDLAQRLKKMGYQLGWCKASIIHHQQPSKKQVNQDQQQFLHYHENRSTLIYTWSHHRLLFIFAAAFRLFAKTVVLPLTRRTRLLPSLFKAYSEFFKSRNNSNQLENQIPIVSVSLFLKR
jgi:GT2 family glycosyltransferase